MCGNGVCPEGKTCGEETNEANSENNQCENDMKGNFWKKIFRTGYNIHGGGYAARYNGKMAKTDTKTTRARLKRFLDGLN